MEALWFDKTKLPAIAVIWHAGKRVKFRLRYNPQMERYTLDVDDESGNAIVHGRVLAYGRDALFGVPHRDLRWLGVIPFDANFDDDQNDVTRDTLLVSVYPWLMTRFE